MNCIENKLFWTPPTKTGLHTICHDWHLETVLTKWLWLCIKINIWINIKKIASKNWVIISLWEIYFWQTVAHFDHASLDYFGEDGQGARNLPFFVLGWSHPCLREMFPRGCCDKAVVLMRAPNAADQAHKRLSLCRSIFTLDLHVNIYNITSIKPTASRQNKNHYIGNILIFQLKSLFL